MPIYIKALHKGAAPNSNFVSFLWLAAAKIPQHFKNTRHFSALRISAQKGSRLKLNVISEALPEVSRLKVRLKALLKVRGKADLEARSMAASKGVTVMFRRLDRRFLG